MSASPATRGPGDPEFDAEFRRRWVEQMRVLLYEKVPDMTEAKFDEIIAAFDKGRDQFVEDMKRKQADARPNTDG